MDSLAWLFSPEGHARFVWAAYAPALVLLIAEAWLVHARLRRARRDAADTLAAGEAP
jgi:heme exporter protein CcmD